ncbi:hypothetical protein FUT69_01160 [Xylella taiwanensis]|uniref:Uncharacterized protein n=1 Tax=Xylella taiwanensis TaxID=1444770 RepID=Z9JLH4_9GAMM|nr:hypothetical protein [Xylella taiwanensis]AXI83051.1 hypothetical protein AB672_03350 [Xylella taiwanensis]EWS78671.1 hypothetical protein AF72_03655 [Xylella taiwanensis]MCD8456081.1 hypothetical protein [Xylella taiwanensis]MCD8458486.1 hypothetical protein [Xylella taiwanensis]MCD8460621.1 hypothetical protein [Xylella taiwanensis]
MLGCGEVLQSQLAVWCPECRGGAVSSRERGGRWMGGVLASRAAIVSASLLYPLGGLLRQVLL